MANWTVEFQYTAALIAAMFTLGLILFFGITLVAWRSREGLSDRYMKLIVIILVVIVAMSVSVSGFGQQTTNSVLGLIGTIVGYLLGRTDRESTSGADE
jgi:hypothetical protein